MILTDSGGSNYESPPVGSHVARCIRIIDLGTQKGEYAGKVNFKRQLLMMWELPNELMSEGDYAGKPFTVSRFYTASLNEKANLRADLENWRGRAFTPSELAGFDARQILLKTCMLSLTPNDKGKVRVTGVMALPKGTQVPEQVNPPVFFSLERNEFDREVFENISAGIKKMIEMSPEYQAILKNPPGISDMTDDDLDKDIPF